MGLRKEHFFKSEDKPLLLARAFYFFYEAATRSLSRYLGLYYKHTLLLTPHQVAILLSARSFALLVGSPLLGWIADKLNRFRNVLILCLIAYLATYISVPFVEPVDGFNCRNHLKNGSLLEQHYKNNKSQILIKSNGQFPVVIHKYQSQITEDKKGNKYYHGNLMYDLFYTWPLDIYDYSSTSSITKSVFVSLLIITLIGELMASPAETFIDFYTVQSLGSDGLKFGHQLIPGLFGWLIISLTFSLISNSSVELRDDFCHIGHSINYSPYMFVIYAMILICAGLAFFMSYSRYPTSIAQDQRFKTCSGCKLISVLVELFKTPSYAAFAVGVIFCGIGAGVKQLYIYHYISEIGGSLILLPVVTGLHFLSNLFALLFSPFILKKCGHQSIILTALLTNSLTFVVYSLIEKPWLVFIVEPFDGIANYLCWVAIITYVGCPPGVGAALQGLFHGLYKGLGVTLGYYIVSVMVLKYGYLAFFLVLGLCFAFIFAIYFTVLHYFPKTESIAEEFSKYSMMTNEPYGYDSEEDDTVLFSVADERVDTAFLDR